MSRLSKKSINLNCCKVEKEFFPQHTLITVSKNDKKIFFKVHRCIDVIINDDSVNVITKNGFNEKQSSCHLGTTASLIKGAIIDFNKPFCINVKLQGVGFRCFIDGKILCVFAGYSHLSAIEIPSDIELNLVANNSIDVTGMRSSVSFFVNILKKIRPWDPCSRRGIVSHGEERYVKKGKKN